MKGLLHILFILLSTSTLLELLPSCQARKSTFTPEERREADSIVRQAKSLEELERLQRRFDKEGHHLASIIALRELGKRLRNESRLTKPSSYTAKPPKQPKTYKTPSSGCVRSTTSGRTTAV